MVKVETEAPAPSRTPPETANPSTLGKQAFPRSDSMRRIVIECEIRPGSWAGFEQGLPQMAGDMDRWGAEAGHLCDLESRHGGAAVKVFRRSEEFDGKRFEVWGM